MLPFSTYVYYNDKLLDHVTSDTKRDELNREIILWRFAIKQCSAHFRVFSRSNAMIILDLAIGNGSHRKSLYIHRTIIAVLLRYRRHVSTVYPPLTIPPFVNVARINLSYFSARRILSGIRTS